MLHRLRLNESHAIVFERVLGSGALVALSTAVASVFATMCDPRIVVPGAPPFGTAAIYGMPVRALTIIVIAMVMAVVARQLPPVWKLLVRFRTAIFVGSLVIAVVLPALPYPHRILGACLS